jgi:hypothetical protein
MNNFIEKRYQGLIVCRKYTRTWSFPVEVAKLIQQETADMSVLHLYGGLAQGGVKLDADPLTRPDVIGNALFPPFACESFDVVIVDPPYKSIYNMPSAVLMPAACLAKSFVWWFHTHYQPHVCGLLPNRWWSVLPSKRGPLRCLIEYKRTRQPRGHTMVHNWRTSPEMQPCNWSRHLLQRPLALSGASNV